MADFTSQTPDLRAQTNPAILQAFAQANQQRLQAQAQQNQFKQQDFENKMQVANALSGFVGNLTQAAVQRHVKNTVDSAMGVLSQTAPSQTVSTMAPDSVVPGPEAPQQSVPNPDYNNQMEQRNKARLQIAELTAPGELGKQAAEQALPKPVVPEYSKEQGVDPNGQPISYVMNPHEGIPRAMDAQHTPLGYTPKPYSQFSQEVTPISQEDHDQYDGLVDRLVKGAATPKDFATARGPLKTKLSMMAVQKDPNYDPTLVPQRVATRKEFSQAGTSGKQVTSQNTLIGHLDTLDTKLAALDNADIPKYNSIANYVKNNAGKPEVKAFTAAKTFVDSELGKAAQGSGVVTNDEREQFNKNLDAASSPAQAHAVIDTWMDLMKSRNDALKSAWDKSMPGIEPPVSFINDRSRALLVKHGYNPQTLEKTSTDNTNRPPLESFSGQRKSLDSFNK